MDLCSSNLCCLRGNCVCNAFCLSIAHLCISLSSVVNGAGMNIRVKVSVRVPTDNSFGFRPRSSFTSSYVNFNFLSNVWTVFHSGHIIFHSPQQDTGFQCLHVLPPLVNPVHSCCILLFLIFTLKLS